jgi:hypothetical protein
MARVGRQDPGRPVDEGDSDIMTTERNSNIMPALRPPCPPIADAPVIIDAPDAVPAVVDQAPAAEPATPTIGEMVAAAKSLATGAESFVRELERVGHTASLDRDHRRHAQIMRLATVVGDFFHQLNSAIVELS